MLRRARAGGSLSAVLTDGVLAARVVDRAGVGETAGTGVGAAGEAAEATADGPLATGRALGVSSACGVSARIESAAQVWVSCVLRWAFANGLVALSFTDGILTTRISGARVENTVGIRVT